MAASSFEDYLGSLGPPTGGMAPAAQPQAPDLNALAGYLSSSNYFTDENPQARISALLKVGQSSVRSDPLKGAGFIREGFAPAFESIRRSSAGAGSLLRQGYEDLFSARSAGLRRGYSATERSLESSYAGQGLSPDVASRMLDEHRSGLIGDLGQARGEASYGLMTDLAELLKGTGTEIASLTRDQFEQMVNYLVAQRSAKATEKAGQMGAFGKIAGSVIGAAIAA